MEIGFRFGVASLAALAAIFFGVAGMKAAQTPMAPLPDTSRIIADAWGGIEKNSATCVTATTTSAAVTQTTEQANTTRSVVITNTDPTNGVCVGFGSTVSACNSSERRGYIPPNASRQWIVKLTPPMPSINVATIAGTALVCVEFEQ